MSAVAWHARLEAGRYDGLEDDLNELPSIVYVGVTADGSLAWVRSLTSPPAIRDVEAYFLLELDGAREDGQALYFHDQRSYPHTDSQPAATSAPLTAAARPAWLLAAGALGWLLGVARALLRRDGSRT